MTTCRSKLAFAFGAALSLAGCAEFATPGGNGGVTRFDIMEGHVRVVTPPGYCVDTRSSRPGFVLAARCDRLGVEGRFTAQELGIVTVTAIPATGRTAPDATVLANLSFGDDVLENRSRDGLALVRLKPSSEAALDGAQYHWRGAFEVRDHLIGLTIYAPEGSTLAGAEGARLLADFADNIVRASKEMPARIAPARSVRPNGRPGSTVAQEKAPRSATKDAA